MRPRKKMNLLEEYLPLINLKKKINNFPRKPMARTQFLMIGIINIIDGEVQTTDFYFYFLLKLS